MMWLSVIKKSATNISTRTLAISIAILNVSLCSCVAASGHDDKPKGEKIFDYPEYTERMADVFPGPQLNGYCTSRFSIDPSKSISENLKDLDSPLAGDSIGMKDFDFDCVGKYFKWREINRQAKIGDEYALAFIDVFEKVKNPEVNCNRVLQNHPDSYGDLTIGVLDDIYYINSYISKFCENEEGQIFWLNQSVSLGNRSAFYRINEVFRK